VPSFDYAQFLTQAAADARYQALGSLGSSTPGTETPDHAGTAGVSTSAARQDHIHPITCAVPVALGATLAEGVATTFARSDHVHTGPLGTLTNGYAQVTANQNGIGTALTDLTSLTVTVTPAAAGRRLRITGYAILEQRTSAGLVFLTVMEGATQLNEALFSASAADTFYTCVAQAIVTPTLASHTYKLQAKTSANTVDMQASATLPAFILVEDIGV
jgi:hypothetical protein